MHQRKNDLTRRRLLLLLRRRPGDRLQVPLGEDLQVVERRRHFAGTVIDRAQTCLA